MPENHIHDEDALEIECVERAAFVHAEARDWIADANIHMATHVQLLSDERIRSIVEQTYEGGWRAFVASLDGSVMMPIAKPSSTPVGTVAKVVMVTIGIVVDETSDMADLLAEIDGRTGTLDVAGFRFDATVEVPR